MKSANPPTVSQAEAALEAAVHAQSLQVERERRAAGLNTVIGRLEVAIGRVPSVQTITDQIAQLRQTYVHESASTAVYSDVFAESRCSSALHLIPALQQQIEMAPLVEAELNRRLAEAKAELAELTKG